MPYLLWSSEYETGIPLIDNDHQTLFAVGALLFVITFAMNVLAHKILRKFRAVGE